ncbi:bleomycin resistance protein [Candidatus Pantoea bituminis]|uniref:bleomycin resistance protein n=1 Tax=Candidatus Pantoea bituminis TaxID=2831036 RepID=UPI001C06452E|nr:VOC family protein [Pantoea bituminis]
MADLKDPYWNRMVPELTVTDFPASLYFYVDVLGFNVVIKRSDPDFAYVSLGEAQIMLEQYHAEGWNTSELVKPLGRGVNFQIEVDDIEQILARLLAHGISLYRALRDNHYSTGETIACQREFLVQDPDGYLLRFSQYIE